MKINSYETEKFEIEQEYWTYYMDVSNKGNKLKDYTGIMKVKLLSKTISEYSPLGHKKFEIIKKTKPLGDTIANNIHNYFEGYGSASCNFFDDYDECVDAHDKQIIDLGKHLNTDDREVMYDKLIITPVPEKSKIEINSINWYNSLSKLEQSYVKWIKDYYEEIE